MNINLESVILYNASSGNITSHVYIWKNQINHQVGDVILRPKEFSVLPQNNKSGERDLTNLYIFLDNKKNKVISDLELFGKLKQIEEASENEIRKLEDQIKGIKQKAKQEQQALLNPVVEKVLKDLELEKAATERKE